jgi:glycosyltransferase involved in cell wall biosynthesis
VIIAIDGNEANVKNRVGSNVYAFQLLKSLYQKPKTKNQKHISKIKDKYIVYLKNKPLADLPKEESWWKYEVLEPKFLWTQWRLPLELYLSKEKPAVFFTPGHYAPRFCPSPLVMAIMDLAFLRYPHQFRRRDLYTLKNWTKKSVAQASHILTISEFTKKEIIHFYNYPAEKITVTYPGIKKIKNKKLNIKDTYQKLKRKYNIIKRKYFLYIGTLQPRKNLTLLIEAFKSLNTQYSILSTRLVIVGKKGWLYKEIFEKVKALGLEKNVIFTGYLPEEEKFALLKNAFAFILPSLYEGFGIPVLEAMQVGCPVIVSKTSSLPEVAGQAAIYINNPQSIDSLYQAMRKMVKLDENKRKELISQGFKQAKKFSWEKAAKQTLKVLESLKS